MTHPIASQQGDNIVPPRKSATFAIAVTDVSAATDLRTLLANADTAFSQAKTGACIGNVFLTITAETAAIYLLFGSATLTASATATSGVTQSALIPLGSTANFRVVKGVDNFVAMVCAAGLTATARIFVSSNPQVGGPP